MQIFGFEIARKKQSQQVTVVAPSNDDGATVVTSAAGYYAQVMNLEATIKNENDLIRRYREIAQYPDCDGAIDDIVNEAIVADEDNPPIEIVLDDLKISASIKKKIEEEFENVLKLLKFDAKGHDIFRTWYIDGRIYYQILLDDKNPKDGIVELRQIDPRKIRKIKNVEKQKNENGVEIVKKVEEYYIYNDKGINETSVQGIKLPLDSVIYTGSGMVDANSGLMLSYLHKAIKLVNQLKMMEDALVIYRISRAPERRIFYVDVGNLPKLKAEQYVNDLMNKFRNKVVYDATTGEVRDDRKHMSMMEDFWMPRREGGKGTEIQTLPGGQNLGEMEDVKYHPGNSSSNQTEILNLPVLHGLKTQVEDMLLQYLTEIVSPVGNVKLRITQSWANLTVPGGSHHCHYHPNSLVSGVLYINAVNEEITFYKSGFEPFHFGTKIPNEFNTKEAVLTVNTGDVILFPSSLYHEVRKSNGDRLSIAFNTFPEGTFGDKQHLTEVTL